jgi:hypothetical protein
MGWRCPTRNSVYMSHGYGEGVENPPNPRRNRRRHRRTQRMGCQVDRPIHFAICGSSAKKSSQVRSMFPLAPFQRARCLIFRTSPPFALGAGCYPLQQELIRAAAARMPAGSEIVAAMDADKAGRELAEVVRKTVELSGRADLKLQIDEPQGFRDFNDALRARRRPSHLASWSEARPA